MVAIGGSTESISCAEKLELPLPVSVQSHQAIVYGVMRIVRNVYRCYCLLYWLRATLKRTDIALQPRHQVYGREDFCSGCVVVDGQRVGS